jgi:hypothetical protein
MTFGHLIMNNSRATYQGGFLKNSEFLLRRDRADEFGYRTDELL